MMTEAKLFSLLRKYNQDHILDHYHALPPEGRRGFLQGSEGLDFDLTFSLYRDAVGAKKAPVAVGAIGPAPIITIPKDPAGEKDRLEACRTGETLLRENKVAVLIVAGGQGSRLGFDGPKGAFPISPIRNKTLFCLFCESLKAMSLRYGARIPLVVMTSEQNDRETRAYFESCRYFGLDRHDVFFFQQGMLPSISPEGKLILKDTTHFFTNPDGHGGSLKGIHDSGLLKQLTARGITQLFYCQVDNPLVKMVDPVFLGYHRMAGSEMSTKVVRRKNVEEKVGVYVTVDGKEAILEYSDLDGRHMQAVDADGKILYWGGNTAIHILDLSFIERLNLHGFALPYHRAARPVEALGSGGSVTKMEGWKFETFVFDAIPLATKTCCMEVVREEEFSPVKNGDGVDSPYTARLAMSNLFGRWLEEAGIEVPPGILVEISPLFATDKEQFVSRLNGKVPSVEEDTYFGE